MRRRDPRPAQRHPGGAPRRPQGRARGHSLGGAITVAYATWDFGGRAGAADLSGLVLIDGGSGGPPISRGAARAQLDALATSSPFLDLTGLGLPWSAGVFSIVGSTLARLDPDSRSLLHDWPALPANLKAPVPPTNAGGYGYAVDSDTSPDSLRLVRMHLGGLAPAGDPRPGSTASSAPCAARPSCSPASRASTAPLGTTRAGSASTAPPCGRANARLLGVARPRP